MNNSLPTVSAITTNCDMAWLCLYKQMQQHTVHASSMTPACENFPPQAAYVLFINFKNWHFLSPNDHIWSKKEIYGRVMTFFRETSYGRQVTSVNLKKKTLQVSEGDVQREHTSIILIILNFNQRVANKQVQPIEVWNYDKQPITSKSSTQKRPRLHINISVFRIKHKASCENSLTQIHLKLSNCRG